MGIVTTLAGLLAVLVTASDICSASDDLESAASSVLQELHWERTTSSGRRELAKPVQTPGCICPSVVSPVCNSEGQLVAPSTCEALCRNVPPGSFSHEWCAADAVSPTAATKVAQSATESDHAGLGEGLSSGDKRQANEAHGQDSEAAFIGVATETGAGHHEVLLTTTGDMSHGSFLELTPSGFVAAWFSGEGEGSSGVGIYMSHKGLGLEDAWTPAELVVASSGFSMQNPVLLHDGVRLHLFHTCQDAIQNSTRETAQAGNSSLVPRPAHHQMTSRIWHHVAESEPGGHVKFHKVGELPLEAGAFDRNRIVPGPGGDWLFPVYYTSTTNKREDFSSLVRLKEGTLAFESELRPQSWPPTLVQPSIVHLKDSSGSTGRRMRAFFRDRRKKSVHVSDSEDGGYTWSKARPIDLVNGNAALQAAVLSTGEVILVLNPIRKRRYHLSVAVSFDDGETFPILRSLECAGCYANDGANPAGSVFAKGENHGPEFSYPSVVEGPDTRIHITYTWSMPGTDMAVSSGKQSGLRAAIKYVALSRSFLGLPPPPLAKNTDLPGQSSTLKRRH